MNTARFSPEKNLQNNDPLKDKEKMQDLHKKALREIEAARPNMRNFVSVYGHEAVERDIEELDRLEREFREADKNKLERVAELATICEYFFFKYSSKWTDGHAEVKPASHYDDVKKKTDMILDCDAKSLVDRDGRYHAMSIDVVLGKGDSMISKLMNIRDSIDEGWGPVEMKYFKPKGKTKVKTSLVRGVASFSEDMARSLVAHEFAGDIQGIENHYAPYVVFAQLKEQYYGFYEYAKYVGNKDLAKEYLDAYMRIDELYAPLAKTLELDSKLKGIVEKDEGLQYVRGFMRILKETYAEAA